MCYLPASREAYCKRSKQQQVALSTHVFRPRYNIYMHAEAKIRLKAARQPSSDAEAGAAVGEGIGKMRGQADEIQKLH